MVCNPLINATLFSHRNTLSLTWRLPRLSSWMQRYRTPLSPLAFSTMHHVTSCILFQRQHIYLQETRVQNWWRLYHNRLQFCQPAVFHMLYHNRKQDYADYRTSLYVNKWKEPCLLVYFSKITSIVLVFSNIELLSVSFCVCAGADKHGQAGSGASSAVVRCWHRGGEMGGAGTWHCPTEPEPGQHGLQHAPVHQVTATRATQARTGPTFIPAACWSLEFISELNIVKPLKHPHESV